MPYISFEGPKLTKEQKAQLVKEISEVASGILNIPKDNFIVSIKESDPDNVGIGGELLSEKFKREK